MVNFILASIGVFLSIILVLVIILLIAKKYLSPSGNVTLTINGENKLSHTLLYFKSREAHHSHCHESYGDECNTESL